MSTAQEREYLRDLAKSIAERAADPAQQEKIVAVKACNDLRPTRPIVFARPENGWPDLHEEWGPLRCSDPRLQPIEDVLQKTLIRAERIRDDMPILAELRVPLVIDGHTYNDFGVELEVTETTHQERAGAYHIEPAIKEWTDLEKLRPRKPGVDYEQSRQDLELAGELLGDLLDVWQCGFTEWRYGLTRILIHMRGFQQFLMDFYDNPDQTHELMSFLADSFAKEIDYFIGEQAVSPNALDNDYIGVGGPCATDDLPGRDHEGPFTTKDFVCWTESQETVGVSPTQFEEFVFRYQKPLTDKFGLCGYGCCEGLEDRFDIIANGLPNLRWLAVSPWGDSVRMAEQIGKDYVYLYKVNPALVVAETPDWDAAAKQVADTHAMTQGMAVQYSLKDTNTFCGEPERISRWVEMTRSIVMS